MINTPPCPDFRFLKLLLFQSFARRSRKCRTGFFATKLATDRLRLESFLQKVIVHKLFLFLKTLGCMSITMQSLIFMFMRLPLV